MDSAKTLIRAYSSLLLTGLILLTGCSSDSVDVSPGISAGSNASNTPIVLRGTVNETELAVNNTLDVKSSDGQRASLSYSATGEYEANQLPGTGPWLLRVELDQDRSIYGIAYSDGTRNINSFSDISLRRWFALASMDLDEQFDSNNAIPRLPSSIEYDTTVSSIFVLIDLVLGSYQITGNDVISTRYISNDQGVDRFLNRNRVVLEDGLITFALTDPTTEIQTETTNPFELASTLQESGEPPTTPGSVRAVATNQQSIRLVWEPSVDDVSVVGYVVLRDNTLLGTSPYPQFVDDTISNDQSSQYVIVAIDGAGNSSLPTVPVVANVNATVDNVPPPAPTQLSILSTSNTATRLGWIPPNIADVVSYQIFRAIATDTASLIQNVALATATDTEIRDEVLYCYQVSAVDGSGNTSPLSNSVCTGGNNGMSTDGTATTTFPITSNPVTPTEPTTGGIESVGEWNIVDLDSLDCSSVITPDQITVGRLELSSGCFTVPETLVIDSGATLRLGQGVVLRLDRDAAITVLGGTLTALGTRDNPVIFTGVQSRPGSWAGIEFFGNSTGNTLDGVVIQYGGGGSVRAAVSTRLDGARFRMLNTLVQRTQGPAVSFNSFGIRIDEFSGNRIQDNDGVGNTIITSLIDLVGNTEYTNNTVNKMLVTRRELFDIDVIIPPLAIPISSSGIQINRGSLTIQPGVDLEMIGRLAVEGEFNAIGSAEQPIIIRGRPESTVGWDGLLLSGDGDKNINHAFIIGGGANSATTGAIEVDCTLGDPFTFNINNTDIVNSEGWGIFAAGDACTYNIGPNVTFSNTAFGEISLP